MGALCTKPQYTDDNIMKDNTQSFGRRDFIGVYKDRDIYQDYEIVRELGKGSFAHVKLAINKKT